MEMVRDELQTCNFLKLYAISLVPKPISKPGVYGTSKRNLTVQQSASHGIFAANDLPRSFQPHGARRSTEDLAKHGGCGTETQSIHPLFLL